MSVMLKYNKLNQVFNLHLCMILIARGYSLEEKSSGINR